MLKSREKERKCTRIEKRKISIEASKTVTLRLQKILIERGKKPNLGSNFFAYA